ncbi:MAG: hypothetical protein H0X24_22850 [Ktedonobacterales bacterium]|nr:hypothetical protein [Ktedonobacterales bacterium]
MQGTDIDPAFYKPIISISIPPAQREAFYSALLALRGREQRPFVSLSALVVKAVIAAADGTPIDLGHSSRDEHADTGEDASLGNDAL